MQNKPFSSNKPYLFKAIFEWLLDNDATPYLHVDTSHPMVNVPQEHVKDEQIVLNISPTAVQNWSVDQAAISFNARFSGVPRDIYIPMSSVVAIYAKENGLGMVFPEEEQLSSSSDEPSEQNDASSDSGKQSVPKPSPNASNKKNHLKVIK
jgi:stringent starvation protein B